MSEEMMFATESQIDEFNNQTEDVINAQKFLIFKTDGLKMGVDAEFVVEILTDQTVTFLPMMPEFVRGIINMRGQLVPIMDIRIRLGKPPKDDCIILVLNVEGTFLGLLVDDMDQMLDIPKDSILPMSAQNAHELVSGMCSLPDGSGTMMVLDCVQLVTHV